jgi:ABC-type glycerol-3-phosphate transport system permease component
MVMTLQKLSTLVLNWNELSKLQQLAARMGVATVAFFLLTSGRFVVLAAGLLLVVIPFASLWDSVRRMFSSSTKDTRSIGDWDERVSQRLMRQQQPLNQKIEKAKEYFLRFSKHLVICGVLATALLPMYLMLIVSFKTNQQFYEAPAIVTAPMHPENWSTAWELVRPSLANSLYLSISTTFLSLSFALAGAYFFARLRMPLSGLFWNAILVLMMMPTVANLIPLFGLLRELNLINTLSALILVGTASGQVFSIFVLRNFISDVPQDLFEAAEIDGASHFQQLKTIVLPLSGTILGTIGVMLFVQQWNEFVLPLIVMRDEIRLPVMVQLQRLNGSYVKQFGPLMAGFVIASIPVIVLFIFSMKLFIKGMTEGAVKG